MLTFARNVLLNRSRYREHKEAVIVSCFFNPQKSPYRLKAFGQFYESIRHMNHLILECVIGDAEAQLPESDNIQRVHTENLLWHKESLLNLAVGRLPARYRYVFWVDADVLFTNLNWLPESVLELQDGAAILQPFENCVHLERDEVKPAYAIDHETISTDQRQPACWRSFCANYVDREDAHRSENYNRHGHVGFAWGARRDVLTQCPLYERALIGGADHIIAHAAAGQIPHPCIDKSFTEDLPAVYEWSRRFHAAVQGRVAYATGDLYHLWHGDIDKRQYLKRIQEFTPATKQIRDKDKNGLYVTNRGDDRYIKSYFQHREVASTRDRHDDGFAQSMMLGYMTDSAGIGMMGGNPMGAIIGANMRQSQDAARYHHDTPLTPRPQPSPQGNHHASENFS